MPRWRYAIRAFRPPGTVLDIETVHATEASAQIEIAAFRARMKRGEISHIDVTRLVSPYGTERIYHLPDDPPQIFDPPA